MSTIMVSQTMLRLLNRIMELHRNSPFQIIMYTANLVEICYSAQSMPSKVFIARIPSASNLLTVRSHSERNFSSPRCALN